MGHQTPQKPGHYKRKTRNIHRSMPLYHRHMCVLSALHYTGPMNSSNRFSTRVLDWYDQYGRKDLPWQQDISPYRVWVSEIMLQQTQVRTVIPYFERFMARFPDVRDLAAAPVDEVLHLWTGLGYYARARNLHRAAREICQQHGGELPVGVEGLETLPGIGHSTAGAITSIAQGQPATILDGNVKRVLARYHTVAGWPGEAQVLKKLWAFAEKHTPQTRTADYTQAIMDLGATVCTRGQPDCEICPLSDDCLARAAGKQTAFPGRRPRKVLPVCKTVFLILHNADGHVLLQKRPTNGIWGALWCFPELPTMTDAANWCLEQFGCEPAEITPGVPFRHTFSHYHLDIQPLQARLDTRPESIMAADQQLWYNVAQPSQVGLAAPVVRLLNTLNSGATP